MPFFALFTCVAGIFDCPCEVKCTDEVIDDGDFPRSGFLVNMGNFDPVNESTKNSRVCLCQRFTLPNKLRISVPHITLGGILNELRFMF